MSPSLFTLEKINIVSKYPTGILKSCNLFIIYLAYFSYNLIETLAEVGNLKKKNIKNESLLLNPNAS